jgi:hypothetical protein
MPHQPGIKIDILIAFGYLILLDIKGAISFILKSLHKNIIISLIKEKLDLFDEKVYVHELLSFLLDNCGSFLDYINLIHAKINIF